jgi:hypothetical protein
MARSRTPLRASSAGASSSFRARASRSAGCLRCRWPLDAVDRIAGDRVALAEIIEQGRELVADTGRSELT